jgi:hypothetical protein
MRIGKMVIIFGAINFFKDLPYVEADKVFGSPFELAWCDKVGGYDKIYKVMQG